MAGQWTMLRQDVQGLTAQQIAQKYALPAVPTHIVEVEATNLSARVGVAGANFGYTGGGVQIQLLEYAKFTNPQPIPAEGVK